MKRCPKCKSTNIIHNGAVSTCLDCPPKQYRKVDYSGLSKQLEGYGIEFDKIERDENGELIVYVALPSVPRLIEVDFSIGEECQDCGSTALQPTGSCSICLKCGSSVGGC